MTLLCRFVSSILLTPTLDSYKQPTHQRATPPCLDLVLYCTAPGIELYFVPAVVLNRIVLYYTVSLYVYASLKESQTLLRVVSLNSNCNERFPGRKIRKTRWDPVQVPYRYRTVFHYFSSLIHTYN